MTIASRRWSETLAEADHPRQPANDVPMASVHVYAWGNELAARSCVQLGLGLTSHAADQLIDGGLPVSVLCDLPLAEAVAAFLCDVGGKVTVTAEPGLGVRLLARMAPSF